jgi:small-conductance mechanosensitive channel
VIRIKTKKNEVVTIPNSFMMSAQTVNYSESARSYGLIIHQEISIGYDTPWKKVEQLLIDAALSTDGVSQTPKPFVLQTSLGDYAIVYQINAYITEADRMPSITSELFANIQDKFATAGVEITSPEYVSVRNGNKSTIPHPEQQSYT